MRWRRHAAKRRSSPSGFGNDDDAALSPRRDPVRGDAFCFHHHLYRVVDAIPGVADRGRQIVERERVGMDFCGVEALLRLSA
jgi:hypothetical protein